MAFDPTLPLAATGPGLWSRLSGLVRGLLAPAPWSPEEDLSLTPHIDPRLVPRAKMSAEEIDAGALLRLSGLGLRHGKLITAESHPELNAAWNAMCARAGLPRPRQLILCETDMVNAFTLPTGEVAVTTGMFKVLDLRETVAMLGHELGHARHARPEHMHRIATDAVYTGVGAVVGSGVGVLWDSYALEHHTGWMSRFLRPGLLGQLAVTFGFAGLGHAIANRICVHPSELQADRDGIAISGDPEAFFSALNKIEILQGASRNMRGAAYGPLYGLRESTARLRSGYPGIPERIAELRGALGQTPAAALPPPIVPPAAEGNPTLTITAERIYFAPEASAERVH